MKKVFSLMFLLSVLFIPLSSVYAGVDVSGCASVDAGDVSLTVGVGGANCSGIGGGGWGAFNLANYGIFGLPSNSISGIITKVMSWFLSLIGVFGILGFLFSGSMYLLAAGDDDLIKRAKKTMTYSIVGIVVALIGLVALTAIFNLLDAGSTTI
jgi:hypothetical protein